MSNKKEHTFQIGQIIYLLSEEAEAIVPAIVTEEQVVKKLDGNSVTWKVAVGPVNKRREVDSNNLKGELHTSLEEIRETMVKRLTDFVDNMIEQAKKKTEVWYGHQMLEQARSDGTGGKIDPASLLNSIDNDDMFINKTKKSDVVSRQQSFDSNTTYRVKMPTNNTSNNTNRTMPIVNINRNDPKADIKQKLLEAAMPDDFDDEQIDNNEFVMTEDGRRIPVTYNKQ
jgi:hypothetical protein